METEESGVYDDQVASGELGEVALDDFDIDIIIAWLCLVVLDMAMHTREPICDNISSGSEWVMEVVYGQSDKIYEAFGMERHVFFNLCDLMKTKGWLEDSRYVKVKEQVGMFLYMVCHKNSNRDICKRFQRSKKTVSKYFTMVLRAIVRLTKEIIVPPSFDVVPMEILLDPNHERYFKDCIGAIDGIHIHAFVPASMPWSKKIAFVDKTGKITQNVMCVCSFDMKFTFVYAGWEGCASDYKVFSAALQNPLLEFPRPPPGKYYVVDSGYASISGFLTPFKGERYHLDDYKGQAKQPRSAREFFNYRHSLLRNVIERSFAALKNRFFILTHMPSFTIRKQAYIVIACCGIHNYIRDQDKTDKTFSLYGNPFYSSRREQDEVVYGISTEEEMEMSMMRKNIANKMARDHDMEEIP